MGLAQSSLHRAHAAPKKPGGGADEGEETMNAEPVTTRAHFIISAVLIAVLVLAAGGVMVFA